MVIIDKLAEKVFGIVKGFGHQVKMYNDVGAETVDPREARRFFTSDQGMMITIDEDDNEVVLNKSSQQPLEDTRQLQRNLKKLANQFLMNYTVRSYGKSIQPRDFSYQAKIKRNNNNMAESKLNESDAELHDLLRRTKQNPLAVIVTKSRDKSFRPSELYTISDIDTDGGYEPTALFTDRKGNSRRGKLYDIDFRELKMNKVQEGFLDFAKKKLMKLGNKMHWDATPNEIVRTTKKRPIDELNYIMDVYDGTETAKKWEADPKQAMSREIQAIIYFVAKKELIRRTKGGDPTQGGQMPLQFENKQAVNEGLSKMGGSKKTSHQTLENVKILVKHRSAVDEERRGARSRNIQSIFLEREGERFRFPSNHLGGARAMARHMQEGGEMTDRVGNYIIESVSSLIKLQEFYRYAKSNKLINEDSEDIISTVRENINGLKSELTRLTGIKTYESIKSRIEESEELELHEDDVSSLRDMFTVKRFDEKFDDVLPVVSRLVQEKDQYNRRIEEASANPIQVAQRAFAVDSILEFASESAKMGHRLSEISSRIVENPELASFVSNIGRKLCKEGEINAFEKSVMQNVLGNMAPQQLAEEKTEIVESASFEKHFEKYNNIFL